MQKIVFWQYNFMVKHQYFKLSSENSERTEIIIVWYRGLFGKDAGVYAANSIFLIMSQMIRLRLMHVKRMFPLKPPLHLIVTDVLSMNIGMTFTGADSIKVINPSLGIGFKVKKRTYVICLVSAII